MATIKEIAKHAKVSVGSVSNVINGKTQNMELIQKVENSIEELGGYRPDANARSLKGTKSKMIGVIVPDVTQREYGEFLYNLEVKLREKGYSILLKCNRNNIQIKKKCIAECMGQSVDGIVMYSPLEEKTQDILRESNLPAVLITPKEIPNFYGDSVVIDYKEAFETAMRGFWQEGKTQIGLIMEKNLLEDSSLLNIYLDFCGDDSLIKFVERSQEQGFLAFFELFSKHPQIEGVVASAEAIAQGIRKALDILNIKHFPIVVMKESSWIEDSECYEAQLSISQKQVAKKAVQRLLDGIERPSLHDNKVSIVSAKYDKIPSAKEGIKKDSGKLRFAMYDCSSARSLQMLAQIYEKESGKEITFDLFSYSELEGLLYAQSEAQNSYYDGFMMDITWFEGLVESKGVQNLDSFRKQNLEFFDSFVEDALENLGMYVESLYGIPFMSGAQILFYQKDLFEDQGLKIRFKRMYGEALVPPKTWSQFNLIAEFFTKAKNRFSPVEYGVSIPRGENVYTTIGFLSRLWSYGSAIFDDRGKVVVNNANSIAALKNLVESYKFTSGKALQTWNSIADEFSEGRSAMAILYDSDAGDINNYTNSKVAGNIGYALLPGGTPVLGGWSLGLNRYGENKKHAEHFLKWACGSQNGILLPLLGGSTLRKDFYKRSDLENLQPWKNLILESYKQSKKRSMPEILDESRWKNNIYTSLIPREIVRVMNEEISEEIAIEQMEKNIKELVMN